MTQQSGDAGGQDFAKKLQGMEQRLERLERLLNSLAGIPQQPPPVPHIPPQAPPTVVKPPAAKAPIFIPPPLETVEVTRYQPDVTIPKPEIGRAHV